MNDVDINVKFGHLCVGKGLQTCGRVDSKSNIVVSTFTSQFLYHVTC